MKNIITFILLILIIFTSNSFSKIEIKKVKKHNIELIKFQSPDNKFPGKDDIVAQIHFPKNFNGKLPVIIHQHGSSRDGSKFKKWGGKTDEWGKRISKEGVKRGYAVVLIDAFYKRGIKPQNKGKFPNAVYIAINLKNILQKDKRFNKNKFYFTGFSYGASQALKFQDKRLSGLKDNFKAVVAGEPGCNTVSNPTKSSISTLIIKGAESHYYPAACEYYFSMIKRIGNKVEYVLIPKVNHFFSFNGTIGTGRAVNGCTNNIAIRYQDRTWKFADGTSASRKDVIKKCFTNEAGVGKTREKLDYAINLALDFIDKNNK